MTDVVIANGSSVEVSVSAPSATVSITAAVQGAKGDKGEKGDTGVGQQGIQGIQGVKGDTGAAGAPGGSASHYHYTTKTTSLSGDPLNKFLAWNNATQINSTSLRISHVDRDSQDNSIFLDLINQNDFLIIQDYDNAANFQKWEVTGTPIYNTTYDSYPVTLISSGGTGTTNIANNIQALLVIVNVGNTGPTGPAGIQGIQGVPGIQGLKGDTGAAGINGIDGSSGVVSVTAPITNTGTSTAANIGLATTAVTPGSYTNTNITVDSTGRITAASNGSGGGVTSVNTRTGDVTGVADLTATQTFTGTQMLTNSAIGVKPLVVNAITGTTANLQDWQVNSAALALITSGGTFRAAGRVTAGSNSLGAGTLNSYALSAATIGLVVQGAASQTANILEVQNSAATSLLKVDPNGATTATSTAPGSPALTTKTTASVTRTITAVISDGTDVTVTTSVAHGFIVGQRIQISGNSETLFNQVYDILSVPSTTTFKVTNSGVSGTGTGGTVVGYGIQQQWSALTSNYNVTLADTGYGNSLEFLGNFNIRGRRGNGSPALKIYASSNNDSSGAALETYSAEGVLKASIDNQGNFSGLSATFTGVQTMNGAVATYPYIIQPTPTAKTAAATLTLAELQTGIITYSGVAANLQLPLGTVGSSLAGGFVSVPANTSFDWSIINTGATVVTVTSNTAHTIVGTATTAATTSSRWRSRVVSSSTMITYRIG